MVTIRFKKGFNYKDLTKKFAEAVANGAIDVEVDLEEQESIPSEIIGTFVMMRGTLVKFQGRLSVVNANEVVKDLLKISGLEF